MNSGGSLTPNDLRNQDFKTKMRGYDKLEVSAVLEEVAAQWERLLSENLHLREKSDSLEGQMKKYADLEQTLRDTLVVARKAAENEAETAGKEANLIVEKAHLKADSIVKQAESQAEDCRRQVYDLQSMRTRLKAELQAVLRSHTELLSRLGSSPDQTLDEPAVESPKEKRIVAADEGADNLLQEEPAYGPRQTMVSAAQENQDIGTENHATDFDAALNKIFGEDLDTPVPARKKPPVTDESGPGDTGLDELSASPDKSESGPADKQDNG